MRHDLQQWWSSPEDSLVGCGVANSEQNVLGIDRLADQCVDADREAFVLSLRVNQMKLTSQQFIVSFHHSTMLLLRHQLQVNATATHLLRRIVRCQSAFLVGHQRLRRSKEANPAVVHGRQDRVGRPVGDDLRCCPPSRHVDHVEQHVALVEQQVALRNHVHGLWQL